MQLYYVTYAIMIQDRTFTPNGYYIVLVVVIFFFNLTISEESAAD